MICKVINVQSLVSKQYGIVALCRASPGGTLYRSAATRSRSTTTKKAIKPRQLEFRVCVLYTTQYFALKMNGMFFNEILRQEFATQFATRSAEKDIRRDVSAVSPSSAVFKHSYNITTTRQSIYLQLYTAGRIFFFVFGNTTAAASQYSYNIIL